MVECARLEIVYTGNRIGGSNPSFSATTCKYLILLNNLAKSPQFCGIFFAVTMVWENRGVYRAKYMPFYTMAYLPESIFERPVYIASDRIVLSHEPLPEFARMIDAKNYHGHIHIQCYPFPNNWHCINVSVEKTDYRPIPIKIG